MKDIFVTRPVLPDRKKFDALIDKIWSSDMLTNSGPLHNELEERLANWLGVKHLSLINNGTIALYLALKALDLKGKVITTPYSFIATANSILMAGLEPVFVDIEPQTFNLNPHLIEQAITSDVTAIMPVHVYGSPCNDKAIIGIAHRNNLKVVYDAAHAFGVKQNGGTILNNGDVSVLSFHATKVFHTFEGGAVICKDAELKAKIDKMRNFGYDNGDITDCGTNGKMSEIQAAMGLALLDEIPKSIELRRQRFEQYVGELHGMAGLKLLSFDSSTEPNYSYFPVLVEDSFPISRNELFIVLQQNGIYTRKYFYPLITDFSLYKNYHVISEQPISQAKVIASQVICLPLYPGLTEEETKRICSLIKSVK